MIRGLQRSGSRSDGTRSDSMLLRPTDNILVTGAAGFIGQRVMSRLLERGFRRITRLVRTAPETLGDGPTEVKTIRGNLALRGLLARHRRRAGYLPSCRGSWRKSYPDAFLNSVVTTRNLLDACRRHGT